MQNEAYDDVSSRPKLHNVIVRPDKAGGNYASPSITQYKNEQLLLSYIDTPSIYGRLHDEDIYLNVMKLFFQSTDETTHRHQYFENYARENRNQNHFMDVGIGDGKITKILAPSFKNATLIDVNKTALCQKFLKEMGDTTIKTFNRSITDATPLDDTYDLIVLSHVLYYLSPHEIAHTLNNLFKYLNDDGKIIIVLSGGRDKEKIINYFGGDLINLSNFTNQLNKIFEHVSTYDIEEYSSAYTRKAALHIAGFYLYDGGVTATHEELSRYIEKYRSNEQTYRFEFIQRFFVISKNET